MRPLRLLPLVCLSLLSLGGLSACNKKPDFDEEYQDKSRHISATANSIQKQVADQMSGAAEAERAAAETAARIATPGNGPSIQ